MRRPRCATAGSVPIRRSAREPACSRSRWATTRTSSTTARSLTPGSASSARSRPWRASIPATIRWRGQRSRISPIAQAPIFPASGTRRGFSRGAARLVVVGHDVWIGHAAIILPGRTVGTGAVIGAGAVVTKDVDPYAIVAGNPARVIRQRFPAAVAQRLQRLAWWDWDHDRLRAALPDFRQPP